MALPEPCGDVRVVALLGSVRDANYTGRALAKTVDELRRHEPAVTVDVIDPASFELPLPGRDENDDVREMRAKVEAATGIVFATPEYHGSMSSVSKLLIDNLGFPSTLAGKPVALLGVAAGRIGAIKALEHLRSVLSHVGALVLPGPVSIANVRKVFDDDGNCLDQDLEQQIRGVATRLLDYIENFICPKIALEEMVREGEDD